MNIAQVRKLEIKYGSETPTMKSMIVIEEKIEEAISNEELTMVSTRMMSEQNEKAI